MTNEMADATTLSNVELIPVQNLR